MPQDTRETEYKDENTMIVIWKLILNAGSFSTNFLDLMLKIYILEIL